LNPGTAEANICEMSDQPPIFKVREGNPGFGWVVEIGWPGEPSEEIKGFATDRRTSVVGVTTEVEFSGPSLPFLTLSGR
jgi:hypothetical protein